MQFLKIYGIAFAIFICLDGLWLGLVAKDFYRAQIGFLMKDDINWWAALIFYVLFINYDTNNSKKNVFIFFNSNIICTHYTQTIMALK